MTPVSCYRLASACDRIVTAPKEPGTGSELCHCERRILRFKQGRGDFRFQAISTTGRKTIPAVGIELTRGYPQRILSAQGLP